MDAKVETIFNALRTHPKLGRGSCSSLDECYEDSELRDSITRHLSDGTFTTANGAIKYHLKIESIRAERANEYKGW